jgi:hypothetical protein
MYSRDLENPTLPTVVADESNRLKLSMALTLHCQV